MAVINRHFFVFVAIEKPVDFFYVIPSG